MSALGDGLHRAAIADASSGARVDGVLGDLKTSLRDCETKIAQRITTMVVLAALFGLIQHAYVGQFSALGITIDNTAVLKVGIPVVVAYLYHSTVCLISTRRVLEEAYESLFQAIYPELHKANATRYMLPLHAVRLFVIIGKPVQGPPRTLLQVLMGLSAFSIGLLPPAFIAYGLIHCVNAFGLNVATAGAILLSIAFAGQAPFIIRGTLKVVGS